MKLMDSRSLLHWLVIILVGMVATFAEARSHERDSINAPSQETVDLNQDVANRPVPPSSEPRVRVRLRSYALDSTVVFGESGQQLVCFHQADSRLCLRPAPLQITPVGDGWRLVDGDMCTTDLIGSERLSIRTLVDHASNMLFEGGALPGFVDLFALKPTPESPEGGRLEVIVSVPLETYLPGVLDVELYGHWPLETFKAQAVAARSFALAEAEFWRTRRHFDLVAGPESQGWSGDQGSARSKEAVLATAGRVLLHEGRVIPAYYSASCGGLPASAEDAISSRTSHRIAPLVPLKSRPMGCCSESTVFEWHVEFARDDLDRAIRIWLGERGEQSDVPDRSGFSLQNMIVLERSPTGRPLVYGLSGSIGCTVRIDADSFRRLLSTVPRIEQGRAAPLRSSVFSGEFRGRRFLVNGLGWGHGCGLCQYGANAMGKRGANWREILDVYYPGCDIRVCWGPEVEESFRSKAENKQ